MKRQNIRKALILIAFLLFPVTLYYLSPYLIIMGGFEGIISGSFIVFVSMLVVSLFFGRAFCSWVCPAGGLQECCALVNNKRNRRGWRSLVKYFIWVPWVAAVAASFIAAGGVKKLDALYQTTYGISVASVQAYVVYFGVIILIVCLSFIAGRRSFCHSVCWMAPFMIIGKKISNTVKLPILHLRAEKDKCTNCKLCTKNCPMSLEVNEMVQKGSMNNNECILCGECADGCPKKTINYCFGRQK